MQRIMENKQLKRIEDYNKTLPVLEVYTAVQSEGSRQGYPTIVIRTILQFIQKKEYLNSKILSICTMQILILQK